MAGAVPRGRAFKATVGGERGLGGLDCITWGVWVGDARLLFACLWGRKDILREHSVYFDSFSALVLASAPFARGRHFLPFLVSFYGSSSVGFDLDGSGIGTSFTVLV